MYMTLFIIFLHFASKMTKVVAIFTATTETFISNHNLLGTCSNMLSKTQYSSVLGLQLLHNGMI